eukprot:CAMPEP_0176141000 /NCGR_PEP_ID=MMETSP0120_2-20121206/71689_1 /TAXON_ID=160619 /ORGANISM="Kryptoperidinium foliaceum, Strain CCMP 1326" /LENGTH=35 /DNA_ID= /DNA_START= /DNA_END= /DNA_ORIENTATION=
MFLYMAVLSSSAECGLFHGGLTMVECGRNHDHTFA